MNLFMQPFNGKLKARFRAARLGLALVPFLMALMPGAMVSQAAVTVVVDDVSPADNCGSYDGDVAQLDPVPAISTAANNTTVVICPGTYSLTGNIAINGFTKLTIKQARTDPGDMPRLIADGAENEVFYLTDSSGVTIDGLILDGQLNQSSTYAGMRVESSEATLKNMVLWGSAWSGSSGILINNFGGSSVLDVTITDSFLAGYMAYGVDVYGAVTLDLTGSTLDGTDGGRLASAPTAVRFYGASSDATGASGSVTDSRLVNNDIGVEIFEAEGVTVSDNELLNTTTGIYVEEGGAWRNADDITITDNTIKGVPAGSFGIGVANADAANASVDNLTITGNVITPYQYGEGSPAPMGIWIYANVSALTTVTGEVSDNSVWGFQTDSAIVNQNDYAGVTISDNLSLP